LERSAEIPDLVTAGGSTIGVRWPSHPFIQAVIRECGFPLAAPSANPSNRISPTNATHVRTYFGDRIPLIVDGGQSQVGIESTVLNLAAVPPRLLRPGMIHEQALLAVTGQLALGFGDSEEILQSPGMLRKHYSPNAKLVVWSWRDEQDLRKQVARRKWAMATVHVIAHTTIPGGEGFGRVSLIPHDAEAFGRAIYSELHHCDAAGADVIIVESVPSGKEWRGIADRLKRAASELD
jgi:L-threonylcarbamoyladenylate synthase